MTAFPVACMLLLSSLPDVGPQFELPETAYGPWVLERFEEGGRVTECEVRVLLSPGRWHQVEGDRRFGLWLSGRGRRGSLDLRPPAARAGIWQGIYSVEADRLTICFSRPGKPRPSAFDPAGDRIIWRLRRD